jgi:hypothetical protein
MHLTIEHHNNIPKSLMSPQHKKNYNISKNSFLPIVNSTNKNNKWNKILLSKIPSCPTEEYHLSLLSLTFTALLIIFLKINILLSWNVNQNYNLQLLSLKNINYWCITNILLTHLFSQNNKENLCKSFKNCSANSSHHP